MKGVLVTRSDSNVKRINPFTLFLKYSYLPMQAGITAFASLLILIFILKFSDYIIWNNQNVMLDSMDVALASVGLILVFSRKFLENFKSK